MEYPQLYFVTCNFCGEDIIFDFWGFPIRREDMNQNVIMSNHRCDYHHGRFYDGPDSATRYPENQVPNPTLRRNLCTVVSKAQEVATKCVAHFAIHIWANSGISPTECHDGWPRQLPPELKLNMSAAEYHDQVHNMYRLCLLRPKRLWYKPFFTLPRLGRVTGVDPQFEINEDAWRRATAEWEQYDEEERVVRPLRTDESAEFLHRIPRRQPPARHGARDGVIPQRPLPPLPLEVKDTLGRKKTT